MLDGGRGLLELVGDHLSDVRFLDGRLSESQLTKDAASPGKPCAFRQPPGDAADQPLGDPGRPSSSGRAEGSLQTNLTALPSTWSNGTNFPGSWPLPGYATT